MEQLEKVVERMEELEGKATSLQEKLESGEVESAEDVKAQIATIREELDPLVAEKKDLEQKSVLTTLESELSDLRSRLDTERKPTRLPFQSRTEEAKSVYGEEGDRSFYADMKSATHDANRGAMERLEGVMEGKAMTEGTDAAGGFLVAPEVSSDLQRLRYHQSVVRPLFSAVRVSSNEFQFPSVVSGLVAGWVAELAEKPSSDLTFASASANIFTGAGLSVASNQLLRDADWSVDQLINSDLAFRLAQLEELAFINGTGEGQPLGILGTKGVGSIPFKSGGVSGLLDAIVNAITATYTEFKAPPDAILMHPRTWGEIAKAKESTSPSTYLIGTGGSAWGRRANDPLTGYGQGPFPIGELFGFPVYTSPNIPTNLGSEEKESRVIVGNFKTGLILDREDVTYASSEHVYFTSNRTVFRAEMSVGFTAARYPEAFQVIEGAGLKGI